MVFTDAIFYASQQQRTDPRCFLFHGSKSILLQKKDSKYLYRCDGLQNSFQSETFPLCLQSSLVYTLAHTVTHTLFDVMSCVSIINDVMRNTRVWNMHSPNLNSSIKILYQFAKFNAHQNNRLYGNMYTIISHVPRLSPGKRGGAWE